MFQEGTELEGSTAQAQSVDVVVDGQTVRIIDTPGIDSDDSGKVKGVSPAKGNTMLMVSIRYKEQHEIIGIVYMHDISQNRTSKSVVESFGWLFEICGKAAMRNVVIATNMWWTQDDPGRIAEGRRRERELRYGYPCYKPALDNGASLVQHNNTAESALDILRQLMGKGTIVLQCQGPTAYRDEQRRQSVSTERTYVNSVYSEKVRKETGCGGCFSLLRRNRR